MLVVTSSTYFVDLDCGLGQYRNHRKISSWPPFSADWLVHRFQVHQHPTTELPKVYINFISIDYLFFHEFLIPAIDPYRSIEKMHRITIFIFFLLFFFFFNYCFYFLSFNFIFHSVLIYFFLFTCFHCFD